MAGSRQQTSQEGPAGPETWRSCAAYSGAEAGQSQATPAGHAFDMLREAALGPGAASLARMIEAEIIPRLMLAHRLDGSLPKMLDSGSARTAPEDVAELARIAVEHDASVARAFIEALRRRGVTLDTIFLDLITPSARLLGEMWCSDLATFTEVTVGLSQMQHLLHYYGPAFADESEDASCAGRALLTVMPGDQHTFGISMVEQFFRRAGWEVTGGCYQSRADLVKLVRKESFDLIGISVGSDVLLGDLTSVIGAVRKASRNRAARVVVGGRLFVEHPEYALQAGADGTACDARQAVLQWAVPRGSRAVAAR